jgi:hypothetical protein
MSASDYGLNADEVERDLVEQIRYLCTQRDTARVERDALRALLAEARNREMRYVLPLYRDSNYLARIDAALLEGK